MLNKTKERRGLNPDALFLRYYVSNKEHVLLKVSNELNPIIKQTLHFVSLIQG
ncbi:MAG: hypothetical protein A4E53_01184 [Pelotomaculum sp. PtaB.Bin104]|nr:MAG: hypothetical protein A4E53_01184 [Pelotomaculum sp. PtaB.Bin104]